MPLYSRLLVASSKGGVGKSTTALGLAVAFAREGKEVLLVDLDSTSRSLDMLTGSENSALFDLGDIADGGEIGSAILRPSAALPTLGLIPACHSKRISALCKEKNTSESDLIRTAVERILGECSFDIVICDTGAGISAALAVADLLELTLITSEQSKTSIRGAEYAASLLEKKGAQTMRLVICAFDLHGVEKKKRAGIIEMIDASFLPCAGVVPYDEKLQYYQDQGMIADEKLISQIAYRNIARRISGIDVRLFDGMGRMERKRVKAL